jgi:signal transduction histidine kinase
MTLGVVFHSVTLGLPHGIHPPPLLSATVFGLICLILGFFQVRKGTSPIGQLRTRLGAVHHGTASRVAGEYPSEVQALVDDLNALLNDREQRVARAAARAGDLAHGLKTPLAVLALEAQQAKAGGHDALADALDREIDRMRRQIDYHLAHARSDASARQTGAAGTSVAASIDGLVRALKRLHAERQIAIRADVEDSFIFLGERQDLDEMLGNLLDNACKWARQTVVVGCAFDGHQLVVTVDDDGPGIAAEMRHKVIQRGVRADESSQGTGLGLAIVRDLAAAYGGSIALEDTATGGTRARLVLPGRDAPAG